MGGVTYVTNVLILDLIVYCALFVKEDKTGKILEKVICTIMHIYSHVKNVIIQYGNIKPTKIL